MPIVLKSGSLNLLEPSGPVQGCTGIALPLLLPLLIFVGRPMTPSSATSWLASQFLNQLHHRVPSSPPPLLWHKQGQTFLQVFLNTVCRILSWVGIMQCKYNDCCVFFFANLVKRERERETACACTRACVRVYVRVRVFGQKHS